MTGATRLSARIAVHAGRFASQPAAFAHLLDVCDPMPDLDAVEIVQATATARLTQWFNVETQHRLQAMLIEGEVFVIVLPGAGVDLPQTEHLRPLGRFEGTVTRVLEGP